MPDDAQTPNTSLPPGLSPVPSEPPASTKPSEGGSAPTNTDLGEPVPIESEPAVLPTSPSVTEPASTSATPGGSVVPVATPSPSPAPQTPPSSNLPAGEAGAAGTFDVPPPSVDPSALAGLATSLGEIPSTPPIIHPADTIPVSQVVPAEPEQKKSRKTSAIIGGLFLLLVLPIGVYYFSQKTPVTEMPPEAAETISSGGTITESGGYRIHTFTASGTFTPTFSGNIEVLVVGGGGGAGSSYSAYGGSGGGGAGGLIYNASYGVAANQAIMVTVGNGGAGGAADTGVHGANGSNSVFGSLTAIGGGGGGSGCKDKGVCTGSIGGSGGGTGYCSNTLTYIYVEGAAGTSGQGYAGGGNGAPLGAGGGGGGGAGHAGYVPTNIPLHNGGVGGVGKEYSISGTSTYYAGGGGGGMGGAGGLGGGGTGGSGMGGQGGDGIENTGGGGGGTYAAGARGGNGGKGVVIIRYPIAPISTLTITPTQTETPTPTSPPSVPGVCDASCGGDGDCSSGFVCATVEGIKRCRKPECTDQFTCVCPAVTATPIPTSNPVTVVVTARPTSIPIIVTATPTPEPTVIVAAPTPKVPVSGVPSILGAATVGGGILLLLLGLLL